MTFLRTQSRRRLRGAGLERAGRTVALACGVWFLLGIGVSSSAVAGTEPAPTSASSVEPELCRQVIAAEPTGDPLYALRRAEQKRAQTARRASRQAKKAMRHTIGGGTTTGTRQQVGVAAEHQDRFSEAIRDAVLLCGCRQVRGDPLRQDCEKLYRRYRNPRERRRSAAPVTEAPEEEGAPVE